MSPKGHEWPGSAVNGREALATVGLLVLAVAVFLKQSYGNTALGFLLLLVLVDHRRFRATLGRDTWTWLTLIYLAFLVAYALALAYYGHPLDVPIADATKEYVKLAFLPGLIVGYWLYRMPRLLPLVMVLLPVGMILRIAADFDAVRVAEMFAGERRAGFGNSPVLFGLWSVILVVIGQHFLLVREARSTVCGRGPQRLAAAGVIAIGALGVALSQTRIAWLVLVVLVPLHLALLSRHRGGAGRVSGRGLAAGVVASVLLVAAVLAAFAGPVIERFRPMLQAPAAVAQGQGLEDTSLSLRIAILREGWDAVRQRPWLGWGPGSDSALLGLSDHEGIQHRGYYHFHCDYLTFTAEYGVPGAVFIVVLFLLPMRWLIGVYRRSGPDGALAATVLVCLAVVAVGAGVNRVLTSSRGPFLLAVLVGAALALRLLECDRRRLQADPARL